MILSWSLITTKLIAERTEKLYLCMYFTTLGNTLQGTSVNFEV